MDTVVHGRAVKNITDDRGAMEFFPRRLFFYSDKYSRESSNTHSVRATSDEKVNTAYLPRSVECRLALRYLLLLKSYIFAIFC
jgi:hypothetical protein